jgi:hypothetical protein
MENISELLKNFNPLVAFLVFIIYTITDALYAKYTLDVANYNEYKAANIGALIHFFLAFGVLNYTQNWLYIFPLALGSWMGTYFLVKKERLKKIKNSQ